MGQLDVLQEVGLMLEFVVDRGMGTCGHGQTGTW
jgi:hypothetical protein